MVSTRKIRAAILALNTKSDVQWTKQGNPHLDTLKEVLGGVVKRSECPPKLTRDYVRGRNYAALVKTAAAFDAAANRSPQETDASDASDEGASPYVPADPKRDPAEVSCYRAAIAAMDEAANAFGGVPIRRRGSELRRVLQEYADARPAIMEHFNRVKERKS